MKVPQVWLVASCLLICLPYKTLAATASAAQLHSRPQNAEVNEYNTGFGQKLVGTPINPLRPVSVSASGPQKSLTTSKPTTTLSTSATIRFRQDRRGNHRYELTPIKDIPTIEAAALKRNNSKQINNNRPRSRQRTLTSTTELPPIIPVSGKARVNQRSSLQRQDLKPRSKTASAKELQSTRSRNVGANRLRSSTGQSNAASALVSSSTTRSPREISK